VHLRLGDSQSNVTLGSGIVVSPASLQVLVGREDFSEEDVLQKRTLPSWGDNLSQEESERLLAYLTAPYVAVPLLLSFFSEDNRVGVLLNAQLQDIVESVLFEPRAFVAEEAVLDSVPVKFKERNAKLGTRYGVLMHEVGADCVVTL
jgi:hypothetical protein